MIDPTCAMLSVEAFKEFLDQGADEKEKLVVAVTVANGKPGMMLDVFSNIQDRATIKQVLHDALEAMEFEECHAHAPR